MKVSNVLPGSETSLNSSTIDELGSWILKGWWSQATILVEGSHHPGTVTDPVSGTLTNTQYLPMGGRSEKEQLRKYLQAIVVV